VDKPTDADIRELNIAIARLCGIPVAIGAKWDGEPRYVHSDRFGKLWLHLGGARCVQPWSPATSFDQAWEHLEPVLLAKDIHIHVSREPGLKPVVELWDTNTPGIYVAREADTPAYAFCLAASTLEDDGG